MTNRQITVYLSVSGASGENIYRRVSDFIKSVGHQVIDASAMVPVQSVSDPFQRGITDLIRQSDVFIGILAGSPRLPEEHADGVVIETGPQPVEIEYATARALRVPQLLYVRESVLDRDSWLARFVRELSKRHRFRGFTSDEELLEWLPEDLILITGQQPEAPAGRGFETGGTDSKLNQQSSEEEGYNEHSEAARDHVAQLYEQARSLLNENKLSEAAELYSEIIGILPSELEAYGRLRDLLERMGRTEEALKVAAEIDERFSAGNVLAYPGSPPPREFWNELTLLGMASELDSGSKGARFKNPDNASFPEAASESPDAGDGPPPRPKATAMEPPVAPASSASSSGNAVPLESPRSSPSSGTATASAGGDFAKQSVPGPKRAAGPEPAVKQRFSEDALRVFVLAELLRQRLEQPLIVRANLLFALLTKTPTRLAAFFLNSLGISSEAMLELLGRKLSRGGKRTIALPDLLEKAEEIAKLNRLSEAQFPFSDNVRNVLSAAESIADEQSRYFVELDHIFIALMRSTDELPGWIGWMLGNEKAEWIRKTLADWSPDTPFTEDSLRDRAIAAGLYSPASASSDAASKDDLLNFKQSASAMVNIVLKQDTVPPLVVGVYGPWGSGKSTYLELVKKGLLAEYDKIKKASDGLKAVNLLVVEYDAWSYSDAPKLWAGLITKIAKKLDEDLGWWGRIKYLFKTHRAKLVGGVLLGLIPLILAVPVALLGLLKPLSAGLVSAVAGPLISIASAWFAQRQAVYSNVRSLASKFDSAPASGVINSIQDEFRDALESWIKQKTGADAADATIEQRVRDNNLKIVVFIDELDRCPLERIVDILEAIKLFLAKEIFIVFMAVDTRVASEAIRLHYKDVRNPDLPREYLEKIVQLPLRVPTARGQHLTAYLKKFMPNVKDDEPSEAQSNVSSDSASGLPTGAARAVAPGAGSTTAVPDSALPAKPALPQQFAPKATAVGASKTLPKEFSDPSPPFLLPQLPDTKTELKMLGTISEQFLESNPRKIKRLLNTYRYIKVLAHAQAEPVQSAEWQQTMLGWLVFTMTWPVFMGRLIEKVEELEPKDEGVLLRAIDHIRDVAAKPSEADVRAYLPVSGERIKALWELAGNFLIENTDPGSVSHSDPQVGARGKPAR